MTRKNIGTILFPSIVMIVITVFATSNLDQFIPLDYKGIFVVSIVALFPLLIFIQGMMCAINQINLFLSLGLSLLTTIGIGVVFSLNIMNVESDALSFYVIRYLKYGLVGYLISYILIKIVLKIRSYKIKC